MLSVASRLSDLIRRDVASMNIMMDPGEMFPLGFHPAAQRSNPKGSALAPFINRSDTASARVKYHIIDFGESRMFNEDEERTLTGVVGHDTSVPEMHSGLPYDAFKADVYVLGNVFRKRILEVKMVLSALEHK
jgi:hypothetical protein